MAYRRKTVDCWRFYVCYNGEWEHELTEYSLKDARQRQKEYAENCPQYPTRIARGRERKSDLPAGWFDENGEMIEAGAQ